MTTEAIDPQAATLYVLVCQHNAGAHDNGNAVAGCVGCLLSSAPAERSCQDCGDRAEPTAPRSVAEWADLEADNQRLRRRLGELRIHADRMLGKMLSQGMTDGPVVASYRLWRDTVDAVDAERVSDDA